MTKSNKIRETNYVLIRNLRVLVRWVWEGTLEPNFGKYILTVQFMVYFRTIELLNGIQDSRCKTKLITAAKQIDAINGRCDAINDECFNEFHSFG